MKLKLVQSTAAHYLKFADLDTQYEQREDNDYSNNPAQNKILHVTTAASHTAYFIFATIFM